MGTDESPQDRVERIVAGWEPERPRVRLPDTSRVYFVDPDEGDRARDVGRRLWLPVERAYGIFVCAYAALFAVPPFTDEALARQYDRFSRKRLPLTIRSTSSFILDAFGHDRRTGRDRDLLYSPGPVISSNHSETAGKARISGAAMAWFGIHLIRTAERDRDVDAADRAWHYDYIAGFFRQGGYGFPPSSEADAFVEEVDASLAGDTHADLWRNAVAAADTLDTGLTPAEIADTLPERCRARFTRAVRGV